MFELAGIAYGTPQEQYYHVGKADVSIPKNGSEHSIQSSIIEFLKFKKGKKIYLKNGISKFNLTGKNTPNSPSDQTFFDIEKVPSSKKEMKKNKQPLKNQEKTPPSLEHLEKDLKKAIHSTNPLNFGRAKNDLDLIGNYIIRVNENNIKPDFTELLELLKKIEYFLYENYIKNRDKETLVLINLAEKNLFKINELGSSKSCSVRFEESDRTPKNISKQRKPVTLDTLKTKENVTIEEMSYAFDRLLNMHFGKMYMHPKLHLFSRAFFTALNECFQQEQVFKDGKERLFFVKNSFDNCLENYANANEELNEKTQLIHKRRILICNIERKTLNSLFDDPTFSVVLEKI